ncbi:hypothetical protein SESBI_12876 [Sesbania bispinosa]|nr:hypothetical protein SESBI_12876 [Sesbania bispinosa]
MMVRPPTAFVGRVGPLVIENHNSFGSSNNFYVSYQSGNEGPSHVIFGHQSRNAEDVTQLMEHRVLIDTLIQRQHSDFSLIKDEHNHLFLMEYNMQGHLRDVCAQLKIPQPIYKRRDVRVKDNVVYYQYSLTIKTRLLGSRYWWGNYSSYQENAREDVAAKVVSKLLFVTGKNIGDYNYYKKVELEKELKNMKEEMDKLRGENNDLRLENGCLHEEIRLLNFVDNSE